MTIMTASSRGGSALRAFQCILSAYSAPCSKCASSYHARSASRRLYSSSSTAAATAIDEPSSPPSIPSPIASSPRNPLAQTTAGARTPPEYDVHSGLILTRPPLLTRQLHPFENAFYFYQKRLEERLNTPFITSIYFKPDTAAQLDWNLKVKERGGTVAKELGQYHGKSSKAWDDELKVGDELSSQQRLMDSLLRDAEARVSDDAEVIAPEDVVPVERPVSRTTKADEEGNVRRLDRAMHRTLYLVVKGKDGWGFPADIIPEDENLHECAKRVLDQAAGVNMNSWIVGRVPVAHLVTKPVLGPDGQVEKKGRKTFFLKGRIMAGQADLKGNSLGYTDFKWLTREELEKELSPEYFKGVRNMMADR